MPVQYRPELHVTAEIGVLNAPAGMLRDDQTWHVFYQFQPRPDQPPRWGHVTSEDGPFFFAECDDALAPVGGEQAVRAGSVIAHEDGAHLYFTSVTAAGTTVQLAHLRSLAFCADLSNKADLLDPNVHRVGAVVTDRSGHTNFRSPSVVRGWQSDADRNAGHAGWLMLAVTGPVEEPVPVILTSEDSRDWQVLGPLQFEGNHGLESTTRLVAPRIVRLRDEVDGNIYDVLLITIEREGYDVSGYMVGTLDGATFNVITGFTRIDYGYDFTRPRNVHVTAQTSGEDLRLERAVIFGILNSTGRADTPESHLSLKESDWANVLSLPRVITLQGGKVYQTPHEGLLEAVAQSQRARAFTGICEVSADSRIVVDVVGSDGEVALRVVQTDSTVSVDRTMNPYHDDVEVMSAQLNDDDTHSLSIIVDGSAVEVYADGGQVALSSRAYVKGGQVSFDVKTEGDARLLQSYEHGPK